MRRVTISFLGLVVTILCITGGWASAQVELESVYAPPAPPREEEGVNEGAVHNLLTVSYLTDYVFRGLDFSDVGSGHEDAANLQIQGQLSFDLGALEPFVGVFANIYNQDPVSDFQEIRPFFGAEIELRPITFAAGLNSYIYPDRDDFNTSEVWARVTLDDSALWKTATPIFSPYVLAAYDYDENNGWYFEAGIRHDFEIEGTGITITALADVAYVLELDQIFFTPLVPKDTGWQHYDIGLIGRYSLNTLFNTPRRYGLWSVEGYLFYTDGIDNDIPATSQLWGGVGIRFEY